MPRFDTLLLDVLFIIGLILRHHDIYMQYADMICSAIPFCLGLSIIMMSVVLTILYCTDEFILRNVQLDGIRDSIPTCDIYIGVITIVTTCLLTLNGFMGNIILLLFHTVLVYLLRDKLNKYM